MSRAPVSGAGDIGVGVGVGDSGFGVGVVDLGLGSVVADPTSRRDRPRRVQHDGTLWASLTWPGTVSSVNTTQSDATTS